MTDRFPRIWLNTLDRFEVRLRVKVTRNRNAFLRDAAEAYPHARTLQGWLTERHARRLTTILAEHYEAVVPHFAALTRRQLKAPQRKSQFLGLMTEWVSREALRKARLIAATDADAVRGEIEDGIAEGLGSAEIARNIRAASDMTRKRADVIARTETHAAATFASVQTVRQADEELGVRMLKQWLPTGDDRTREDHAAMADHPAIPLDEKFTVAGVLMDRPGDPSAPPEQTINCRCALIYTEAN